MSSINYSNSALNNESHRLIGKVQLHHYANFLDKLNTKIENFERNIINPFSIDKTIVTINNAAAEDIHLLDLLHSDNNILSRILASLAAMNEEILYLVNETKQTFYEKLIYYGEDRITKKKLVNLHKISPFVECLQQLQFLVKRSHYVAVALLKQLIAISGKELYAGSMMSCFPESIDAYAELLVCFLTLDSLLENPSIREHWNLYRRTVKAALHNPKRFNINYQSVEHLNSILIDLESYLLTGSIIQNHIDICNNGNLTNQLKTTGLGNEFNLYLQHLLLELEKDDENIFLTQIWLQVNVLFVFQCHLFGTLDRKNLKRISEINKKYCMISISGNIVWYPEVFLVKHVPCLAKLVDVKLFSNNRTTQVSTRNQSFPKESQSLYIQAWSLMLELEQSIKQDYTHLKINQLETNCTLMTRAMKLLKKVNELIKWTTNLHVAERKPITKSMLLIICKLIQVVKSFQTLLQKWHLPLIQNLELVCQQIAHKVLTLLAVTKKSITQEKVYKNQHLDVLSAIRVSESALQGPNTSSRILVARLALSAGGLSLDALLDIRSLLSRLDVMCNVQTLLKNLCNCSFLYWHQIIFPVHLTKVVDSKMDISNVCYLLSAMGDCIPKSKDRMQDIVDNTLRTKLFNPLGQSVETNLRLQTHLHLQVAPFELSAPHDFVYLLPIPLTEDYINVKSEIEHYLSTMFYNLTTVILHDWRTYGEMRQLAQLEFGLSTVEDQLPMQTLDQGLDVLEIMRNIHIFVGKYLYNLNNQIFIEESSENKYLNTINISHVANSIRTHGTGIMNTTVNFTYQFLQKKFFIFSQFMFDEQIKSRLLKDLRAFNENNGMYPYERAEKFNNGIKKLGLNQHGLSYLDLFRKLISHIGNAMGYVRLIRSGGRRCLADATCFIPDLKAVDEIWNQLNAECVHDSAKKAFACHVSNLVDNFEEATEYFKLLVKVFVPVFRNPENIHLRNFYMIVPPLTVNFVEHSLNCKERLHKQNKLSSSFTDDGFAMGLAYIVELLEQGSQLNSLNWFQSVRLKHADDRKALKAQKLAAAREEMKLQQTLELTEKRINAYKREFQLLDYNFNSARIFFQ